MQKKLAFTAIAALMSLAGAANAADIYSRGGFKDGPVYGYPSWAGYYIGVNVGGAWGAADFTDVNVAPAVPFNHDASGVLAGGQVGYAVQLGNLVIGPEVDIGSMGLSGSVTEAGGVAIGSVSSGFYFDITGRLGYAWGPALVYIKGGYAYYGGSLSVNEIGVGPVSHSDLGGWTGGGGVEYQVTPAWSVKAEYQFFEFNTFQLINPVDGTTWDDRFTAQTFKVGVNYHLGGCCAAPLK